MKRYFKNNQPLLSFTVLKKHNLKVHWETLGLCCDATDVSFMALIFFNISAEFPADFENYSIEEFAFAIIHKKYIKIVHFHKIFGIADFKSIKFLNEKISGGPIQKTRICVKVKA